MEEERERKLSIIFLEDKYVMYQLVEVFVEEYTSVME